MCHNMHNSHEYFNRKSGYTEERKKLHFPWNTLRTQQDSAIMVQSQQGALQDKEQHVETSVSLHVSVSISNLVKKLSKRNNIEPAPSSLIMIINELIVDKLIINKLKVIIHDWVVTRGNLLRIINGAACQVLSATSVCRSKVNHRNPRKPGRTFTETLQNRCWAWTNLRHNRTSSELPGLTPSRGPTLPLNQNQLLSG